MSKKILAYIVGTVLCLPIFVSAQTIGLNPTSNIDFSKISMSGIQATFGTGTAVPLGYGGLIIAYNVEGLDSTNCIGTNNSQSLLNPFKQLTGVTNDGILPTFIPTTITHTSNNGGLITIQSSPNNGYFVLSCSNVTTANKYRSIKFTYSGASGIIPTAQSIKSFDEEHIRLNANKNTADEVIVSWDKSDSLQCDSIVGYDTQGKGVIGVNMQDVAETGSFNAGYLETQTVFAVTCFDKQTLYQSNGLTYVSGGNRQIKSFITVPASPNPNPDITNTTPAVVPRTFKLPPNNACRTITFTQDLKQGDVSNEVLALEKMIKGGFYVLQDMKLSFETPDNTFDSKTTTFVSILQTIGGNFSGDGKVTALERTEFNELPMCAPGSIGIYPQTTTIYDNVVANTTSSSVTAPVATPVQQSTTTNRVTTTTPTGNATNTTTTVTPKPSTGTTVAPKPISVSSTTVNNPTSTINNPTSSAVTANTTACRTLTFTSYLLRSSQGNEVSALQVLLGKLGYTVQNTGSYNKATRSAVIFFQKSNKIYPTNGNVGVQTRRVLNTYPLCTS